MALPFASVMVCGPDRIDLWLSRWSNGSRVECRMAGLTRAEYRALLTAMVNAMDEPTEYRTEE